MKSTYQKGRRSWREARPRRTGPFSVGAWTVGVWPLGVWPLGVWACLLGAATAWADAAQAQVLQIAPDGSVTTYAGPAVFGADGVTPLPPPPAPIRATLGRVTGDQLPQDAQFRRAAEDARLSVELIAAVAWRESRRRPDAVSPRGARGEMQLMPATARALGVDPTDDAQNVHGGATYLAWLMRRYDGDLVRTLAAYNAGPAAVDRYGGVPPYKETQAYVAAVLDRLSQVADPLPAPSAMVTARR